MVRRGPRALAFALTTALFWSCSPTSTLRPAQLSVGTQVPRAVAAAPGKIHVVWAFNTHDLLSCESPALALRHLKAHFPKEVELLAVAVGDDPGIVDSYMRRERLESQILRMQAGEFNREFSNSRLPALYVVRGQRIEEATSDSTWSDGSLRRVRSLETVVQALLPRGYAVRP